MSYTVYGVNLSPFVRKLRAYCNAKGIEYTLTPVNIFPMPAWFEEISPLKRIPVLKDESGGQEHIINDTSIICDYLEHKHPEKPLVPLDLIARAKTLWLEEYADSELASRIGLGVFRPIVINKMMGKAPDTDKAEDCIANQLPQYFDYFEQTLGGHDYFVENTLTLADISIATHFVNFKYAGYEVDAVKWPKLSAFIKRMHASDCMAPLLEEEQQFFKQFSK